MRTPKIITNTAYYSLSSFLIMGIGFFLLPVYTKYLTPDDYGKLSVITTISTFLSQLIIMSLNAAASRFHFNSTNTEERAVAWGTILTLVLLNSLFLCVISIIFHHYIIDPFAEGVDFYPLFLIAIVGTALSPLYLFYQQWLRVVQSGLKYTINALVYFLLSASLNLLCLIFFNLGLLSLILSTFFVSLIFFIYSLVIFVPQVKFTFDRNIAKNAIKYSLPLIPHTMASYWTKNIDRILLNNIHSASSAGLYAIGNQIGSVILVVCDGINKAFSPWCFQILSDGDEREFEKLYIFADMAVLLCCIFAFLVSFYSPEVIWIMTDHSYGTSWHPIAFISFGYVANGLYFFFCQPLFYYKTKFILYVSFTALITCVICNLVFIPIWGIIGAGLSFFISMVTMAFLTMIFSIFVEPRIKFHFMRMFMLCFFFLLLSLTVFFFQYILNDIYRISYKILFSLFVVLSTLYLNRNNLRNYFGVIGIKTKT